jgi:hypothetical protein
MRQANSDKGDVLERTPSRQSFWALPFVSLLIAACGGGSATPIAPPSPSAPVIALSGRISFDRVPLKLAPAQGLDFARATEAPARGVTVEAIDSATAAILAATSTDENGNYSLNVPGQRNLFVRAKAQMLTAGAGPTWQFRILNNTAANALYALDGTGFNIGTDSVVRNLHAASGWTGAGYTEARSAAPFAILDTVYQAKQLLLSAQSSLVMPPLDLYWSAINRPASPFCPSSGHIVSTGYQQSIRDSCPVSGMASGGIYIQGDFANGSGDTDEFDQSVVAHEFGHYVEGAIARSDSIGGSHGASDRLDLRVAFSEGWGNAFASMVLNDPVYRDSFSGIASDTSVDIESGSDVNAGWFSETSVQQILWDAFDTPSDSNDGVTLGFTPLFQALVGPHRSSFALAGIHSFATGLKSVAPSSAAAIDTLLMSSPRNIVGLGDFAVGETNSGGQPGVLPVYVPIALNQGAPVRVCSSAQFGSFNRLANRKFLHLDLSSATTVTILITAESDPGQPSSLAANDPDAVLWRQGVRVYFGGNVTPPGVTPVTEQFPPLSLSSGTHVLEVYDYLYANPGSPVTTSTSRCMKVTATG